MKAALLSFAFGEYTIRLASALARICDVGLWLTDQQAAAHLDRLDPAVEYHPFTKPRLRQPHRQLPVMRKLYSEIRSFDPDVLHVQQGYMWFNPVLPLLREYPLVVTVHDPTPHPGDRNGQKTPQFMADIAYKRAAALIVHNDQMREVMADRGTPDDRMYVVPHLTLGEPVLPESTDDGATILFFGRIWPYKGLEYLIKAEPIISERLPDVRIVIAGAGEDVARYREMMVHPDRFEVLNRFIPADESAELFQSASVVALPYTDATQSGVIPMAYHYGKPVVATAVGGLPSQIIDGETGFLVPPRNEEELASAILRLLEDDDLRHRTGANGRRVAETSLSATTVAAQTLPVYEDVRRAGH